MKRSLLLLLVVLLSGACKKKGPPERITWTGVPTIEPPVCGDEGPEDRVYTCISAGTVYTCIKSVGRENDSYTCAPKLFERQTIQAERPLPDAGAEKDSQ